MHTKNVVAARVSESESEKRDHDPEYIEETGIEHAKFGCDEGEGRRPFEENCAKEEKKTKRGTAGWKYLRSTKGRKIVFEAETGWASGSIDVNARRCPRRGSQVG